MKVILNAQPLLDEVGGVRSYVAELATGSDRYRIVSKYGGRLRVISTITQPDVIRKILDHVHQQQSPPSKPPGRASGPINTEIQFDAI